MGVRFERGSFWPEGPSGVRGLFTKRVQLRKPHVLERLWGAEGTSAGAGRKQSQRNLQVSRSTRLGVCVVDWHFFLLITKQRCFWPQPLRLVVSPKNPGLLFSTNKWRDCLWCHLNELMWFFALQRVPGSRGAERDQHWQSDDGEDSPRPQNAFEVRPACRSHCCCLHSHKCRQSNKAKQGSPGYRLLFLRAFGLLRIAFEENVGASFLLCWPVRTINLSRGQN